MQRRQFLRPFAGNNHEPLVRASPKREGTLFTLQPSLVPYSGMWDERRAAHLLRRTITAPTLTEVRRAAAMPLDELLAMLTTAPAGLPDPPPYVGRWMNSMAHEFNGDRIDLSRTFYEELRRWWLRRMNNSGLSLHERMVLFWDNHLTSTVAAVDDIRYIYLHNQLLRSYALGNFREMVRSVSLDKGTLEFLNGRQNKRGSVNENYARELQELFTIGAVDNNGAPNYTQQDVAQAARALTGFDWKGAGADGDVHSAYDSGHDPSDKTFYGETIQGSADGTVELDQLLDIIFAREETARFIVRKIYRYFIYTDGPFTPVTPIPEEIETGIIVPLAGEFRSSGWDIATVMRRLLGSEHFYDPTIIGGMIRSPVDLLLSTARSIGADSEEALTYLMQEVHTNALTLGQWIFVPPGVQGWAHYRGWINATTLTMRHDATNRFIDGIDSFYLDVEGDIENEPIYHHGRAALGVTAYCRQFESYNDDPAGLVADIAGHLLAYPPSGRLLENLLNALLQGQPDYEWRDATDAIKEQRLRAMLKLLMHSPNYQLM